MKRAMAAAIVVLAAGLAWSCSSTTKEGAAAEPVGAEPRGVHNLHWIGRRTILSGSVPEGGQGFDELKARGIRTIISVDGASPDVAAAKARGMRYVHIPIQYSDVTEQQKLDIARAVRDLPGPVYIHCHHGKHRSPAASAAVAIALGLATPEEGLAFMKTAGTAPSYKGLYASVARASVVSAAAIDSASGDFADVRKPDGMVAAMVEVDAAYERLALVRAAGWVTPKDHPDLVPASEAGQLADHMRTSGEDPKSKALGAEYQVMLAAAVKCAEELEEALVKGAPKAELESRWKVVVASCKDCHAGYRDNK